MQQAERLSEFLAVQRDAAPLDKQPLFFAIEDLWERKLWHELTNLLVEYFSDQTTAYQRLPLFETFVLTFADKINCLKFVELGLQASTQCEDDQKRLAFLTSLADNVDKPVSRDGYVYASAEVARVKLQINDFEGARKVLNNLERELNFFDSVENVVHAAFYKVNSDYYHAQKEYALYYRNALLYLACVEVKELTTEDRTEQALQLSLAALVSDSIYNFGDLLLHPILKSLIHTQYDWLHKLLFAFNRGDLITYDALRDNLGSISLLDDHRMFLHQKILLAALTETAFRRMPHDRVLSFASISEELKVPLDEIEGLTMKAFSLGLLKGSIDQVNKTAAISWVQSKILDVGQVDDMRGRLQQWTTGIQALGDWVEHVGQPIWVA